MLQIEFEERIGRKVTIDEYNDANAIYNLTDLDKDDFCKEWMQIRDSRVLDDIATKLAATEAKLYAANKAKDELCHEIIAMMYDNDDFSQRNNAIMFMGQKEYIKYIIASGYKILDADREIIADLLQ